jgi:hypothetical protein
MWDIWDGKKIIFLFVACSVLNRPEETSWVKSLPLDLIRTLKSYIGAKLWYVKLNPIPILHPGYDDPIPATRYDAFYDFPMRMGEYREPRLGQMVLTDSIYDRHSPPNQHGDIVIRARRCSDIQGV